jgi:hypothetical protein
MRLKRVKSHGGRKTLALCLALFYSSRTQQDTAPLQSRKELHHTLHCGTTNHERQVFIAQGT